MALEERLVCAHCQLNLPLESVHDWTCNARIRQWGHHHALVRMGALTRYRHNNVAASLIHSLKYRRIYPLGAWMGQTAARLLAPTGLFEGIDFLVPLPLTPARLHYRGFNQALLIAEGLGAALNVPVRSDVLRRIAERESQTHFTSEQRRQNARNIFVTDRVQGLEGKHLMLIDDVMTTGSTMFSALTAVEEIPEIHLSCFTWAWTGGGERSAG
ncbi:MAG: hypothetical protein K6A32_09385 [Bacteroidales bacterium]|nr:hypothetical protein [Bacteroidales bacterium]